MLSIFIGVMSFFHLEPGNWDFLIGTQVCMVLLAALMLLMIKNYNYKNALTETGIFIIIFFLLILVQPFISNIYYIDDLVFPLTILFILMILNITISNEKINRKSLIDTFSLGLIFIGLGVSFTLLVQMYNYSVPFIMPVPEGKRLISNIAQPNQAACFLALAIASVLYFKDKLNFFSYYSLIFILSIFIALTGSRLGIIFLGVIVFYETFLKNYALKFSENVINFIKLTFVSSLGFSIGFILFSFYITDADILTRGIKDESTSIRIMMQKGALDLFSQNPIFGVGWGNYFYASMENAVNFKWFTFSDHTHFIFSNIAVETGLLGLFVILSLFFYIIKKIIFIEYNLENCFLSLIIIIVGVYSLSEFPLWYLRFLIVFVIALTLLDKRKITINPKFNILFIILSFLLFVGSLYYHVKFMEYNKYEAEFQRGLNPNLNKLSNVFGFLEFKDFFVFREMTVDTLNLQKKVELGRRVITSYPFPYVINKQAVLEGLAGNQDKSIHYFKTLCFSREKEFCERLPEELLYWKTLYPEKFSKIYDEVNSFYMNHKSL